MLSPHPRGLSSHLVQGAPGHAPLPAPFAPQNPSELRAVDLTEKLWPRMKGIFRGMLRSSDPQELLIFVFRTTTFSSKRGFRWKAMSLPEHRLMWNLGVSSSHGPPLPTEFWTPAPPWPAQSQTGGQNDLGVVLLSERPCLPLGTGQDGA